MARAQFIWELDNGELRPVSPRDKHQVPRVPDGQRLLSLDQAADYSGRPRQQLVRSYLKTFEGMLGDDSELEFQAEDLAATPAASAATDQPDPRDRSVGAILARVMSNYDRRLDLLWAWKYSFVDEENWALFLVLCQDKGFNPWSNQVYAEFTWDKDAEGGEKKKLVLVVGIEGIRLKAERTKQRAGCDAPEFQYDKPGQPVFARIRVYRFVNGERVCYHGEARRAEYAGVGNKDYHERMPHHWLAKCAEADGWRKAFPDELGGIYTPEEIAGSRPEPPLDSRGGRGRDGADAPYRDELPNEPHGHGGPAAGESRRGMSYHTFDEAMTKLGYPPGNERALMVERMRRKYIATADSQPGLWYESVIKDLQEKARTLQPA